MSLETVLGIKDVGQLWSGARSWEKIPSCVVSFCVWELAEEFLSES